MTSPDLVTLHKIFLHKQTSLFAQIAPCFLLNGGCIFCRGRRPFTQIGIIERNYSHRLPEAKLTTHRFDYDDFVYQIHAEN